jgi:glycosyltransferase involved in cell wall biosynthesis
MPSRPTPKLSVVSSCYNEEQSLDELYRRLTAVCNAEVAGEYEIVLVDDGSSDRTRLIIGELCKGDPTSSAFFCPGTTAISWPCPRACIFAVASAS